MPKKTVMFEQPALFNQLAIVETMDGTKVALAQMRDYGPVTVTTNNLYAYSDTNKIAQEPFQTIYAPYQSRNRYLPVLNNHFLLLIYHVSRQVFVSKKIQKTVTLSMQNMDELFARYCKEYYIDGTLDVDGVASADLSSIAEDWAVLQKVKKS